MQVTITRTIDLPDRLTTIKELEEEVLEFGRSIMREVTKLAWRRYQWAELRCERCGSEGVTKEGHTRYGLHTLFGEVELARQKVHCWSCRRYSHPLDGRLRELRGHATEDFKELATLSGASWPYAQAAHVLKKATGSEVSHEEVRLLVGEEGRAVAKEQLGEAQAMVDGEAELPEIETEMVIVGLDGGWVRSLDNKEGMEGKVAVVYQGSEQVGKERRKLVGRRFAATFQGSEVIGKLCYKEAARQGVEGARKKAVLGDGAVWISQVAGEHFPHAKRILDLWHLEKRLSEALSSSLLPEGEREVVRQSLKEKLRHGKVGEALLELRALLRLHPDERLKEFVGYVENNAPWIGDYERLQADGYPVGSGPTEKGVDIVINRRMKGRRGMRWRRQNADGIVALRVLHLNGDWDNHWQSQSSLPLPPVI